MSDKHGRSDAVRRRSKTTRSSRSINDQRHDDLIVGNSHQYSFSPEGIQQWVEDSPKYDREMLFDLILSLLKTKWRCTNRWPSFGNQ